MISSLIRNFKKAKNRKAILKAANHLQSHPSSYEWRTIYVPFTKDDQGDGLGWIGYFLGMNEITQTTGPVAQHLGFKGTVEFYSYMQAINPDWSDNASTCSVALTNLAQTAFGNKPRVPAPEQRAIVCNYPDCE